MALASELEVRGKSVGLGIEIETTGLSPLNDQIQVVTVGLPEVVVVIQVEAGRRPSSLGMLLTNGSMLKIIHNALLDMSFIRSRWEHQVESVFCTKIAARLAGIARNPHLQDLAESLLGVQLDKSEQRSDWSVRPLSEMQVSHAASDVAYLHPLHQELVWKLSDAGRSELFETCMGFLPSGVDLELTGPHDLSSYSI
jgi:ribonuclease D